MSSIYLIWKLLVTLDDQVRPKNVELGDFLTNRHKLNIYEELDSSRRQFRLLSFVNLDHNGIPDFKIAVYSLDAPPNYIALSYMCGSDPEVHPVRVDGHIFGVRSNLHRFIQRFATRPERAYPIFIDALCIHQADLEERASQVRLMREIYSGSGAIKTVAWLSLERGPFQRFQRFNDMVMQTWYDEPAIFDMPNPNAYATWRQLDFLNSINSDPFWSRLWVTQEVLLANSLVLWVRHLELDLAKCEKAFTRFTSKLSPLITAPNEPFSALQSFQNARRGAVSSGLQWGPFAVSMCRRQYRNKEGFNQRPLHEIISIFGGQLCSEPRDIVFGILGLVTTHIVPDYSTPLTQLYLHVLISGVIHILVHQQNDDIESKATQVSEITRLINGCMNAFGFLHTDLTVELLTELAISAFFEDSDQGLRALWPQPSGLRDVPILKVPNWLRAVMKNSDNMHDVLRICTVTIFPPLKQLDVSRTVSHCRHKVQQLLLLVARRQNAILVMPDGQSRTFQGWVDEVCVVADHVGKGISPSGSRSVTSESNSLPAIEGNRSGRTCLMARMQFVLRRDAGALVDLTFVLSVSLVLAWLGVVVGQNIDGAASYLFRAARGKSR